MSNRLQQAVEIIIEHEGGYVDDRLDPGGETKYGISKRAHPDLDIKNLTVEQAATVYCYRYWHPVHGDDLPDSIALFTFDAAVQHGPSRARKMLQEALGVAVDGIIGPNTLGAVADANTHDLLVEFGALRMRYYGNLGQFDRYGLGWSRRMIDVFSKAYEWLS